MPAHPSLAAPSALRVRHAATFWQRLGGLLALPRLTRGEALHLAPCGSVHTCFMPYAIDVIYLDAQGQVLKIVPELRPWRFSACLGARSCLELLAGEAERLGLRPGDRPLAALMP